METTGAIYQRKFELLLLYGWKSDSLTLLYSDICICYSHTLPDFLSRFMVYHYVS
jgi:hypothetical protein